MNLLSIDPGSNRTGLAFFEDGILVKTGKINGDAITPLGKRLGIACTLISYIANADHVVCEEPFLQGKANQSMQRLLGMIEYLAKHSLTFVHPMSIKSYMGGGKMDKLEMGLAAGREVKTGREQDLIADAIANEEFDITDAVCIGLWYLNKEKNNERNN